MTPRRDITAIHIGASAEEIIELSKKSRFSRFPVYSANIDAIQGFFYIKDFLFSPEYLDGSTPFQVSAYLRKPIFVFETTKLAQVEKKFYTEQQTMAIVLDEYGGTAGLITVEDVSEEIFGSILDEYDVRETSLSAYPAAPGGAGQIERAEDADGTAVYTRGDRRQDKEGAPLQSEQSVKQEPAGSNVAAANANTHTAVAHINTRTGTAGMAQTGLTAMANATVSDTAAAYRTPAMQSARTVQPEYTETAHTAKAAVVRAAHDSNALEESAVLSIAGITRLADLSERLNLNLESQYSDTIGGYIMEQAGEIPAAGYTIAVEPYRFTVTKVEANRIAHIEVRMQAEE